MDKYIMWGLVILGFYVFYKLSMRKTFDFSHEIKDVITNPKHKPKGRYDE